MILFPSMLTWPDPSSLTPVARKNLDRLRACGAAAELDADAHRWSFEMWSWRDEPTIRVTLRNERDEERAIVIDGDGVWESTPTEVTPALMGRGIAGM
jgi:hypothetical protein